MFPRIAKCVLRVKIALKIKLTEWYSEISTTVSELIVEIRKRNLIIFGTQENETEEPELKIFPHFPKERIYLIQEDYEVQRIRSK